MRCSAVPCSEAQARCGAVQCHAVGHRFGVVQRGARYAKGLAQCDPAVHENCGSREILSELRDVVIGPVCFISPFNGTIEHLRRDYIIALKGLYSDYA